MLLDTLHLGALNVKVLTCLPNELSLKTLTALRLGSKFTYMKFKVVALSYPYKVSFCRKGSTLAPSMWGSRSPFALKVSERVL